MDSDPEGEAGTPGSAELALPKEPCSDRTDRLGLASSKWGTVSCHSVALTWRWAALSRADVGTLSGELRRDALAPPEPKFKNP